MPNTEKEQLLPGPLPLRTEGLLDLEGVEDHEAMGREIKWPGLKYLPPRPRP